jgi:hypothetical protein
MSSQRADESIPLLVFLVEYLWLRTSEALSDDTMESNFATSNRFEGQPAVAAPAKSSIEPVLGRLDRISRRERRGRAATPPEKLELPQTGSPVITYCGSMQHTYVHYMHPHSNTPRGWNVTANEAFTAESRNAAPALLARSFTDNHNWWSNELVAVPSPDWVEERAFHTDDFSRPAGVHLCSPTCLRPQGLSKASSIGKT